MSIDKMDIRPYNSAIPHERSGHGDEEPDVHASAGSHALFASVNGIER